MADPQSTQLRGYVFDHVGMNEATFRDVDMSGARFERVALNGAALRGVEVLESRIVTP